MDSSQADGGDHVTMLYTLVVVFSLNHPSTEADSPIAEGKLVQFPPAIKVWSMALDGILSARNLKLTPRADIIINNIKSTLLSVLKYKPKCSISECLKVRNLIRLLSSGFTPH